MRSGHAAKKTVSVPDLTSPSCQDRALVSRGLKKGDPRMIRVIIDTVLFSCMAAMVTGVVIVAATFLI